MKNIKSAKNTIDQREILNSFNGVLSRETNVLKKYPSLLWQQLYNRLQWEGDQVEEIISIERERRDKPGSPPWAWVKTPYRESKERKSTITKEGIKFTCCDISPDNSWIVAGGEDNKIYVFDATTGKEKFEFIGHTNSIKSCVISPNGKWFVSASYDKTLKIWDVSTGQEIRTLTGHTSYINCCVISSNGEMILSGSSDDTLRLWDVTSGKEIHAYKGLTLKRGGYRNVPHGCTISSDGKYIASACVDKTIRIFSVSGGQEIKMLTGHTNFVEACAFTPGNKQVISGSKDKTIRIWDFETGEEKKILKGHGGFISDINISPDGKKILSASEDNTIKIWDLEAGNCIRTLIGHSDSVNISSWSADGDWILSASDDHSLRIWDLTEEAENQNLIGHQGGVLSSSFSPDGSWFVTSGWDETIKIWSSENFGRARQTIKEMDTGSLFVSKDSSKIYNADNSRLFILDSSSGKVRSLIKGANKPFTVSPDDQWIISGTYQSGLKKWDGKTGNEIFQFSEETKNNSIYGTNPDGTKIVTVRNGKEIKILDVNNGEVTQELNNLTSSILHCSFTHDGNSIVFSSSDNSIKIWDLKTEQISREFKLIGDAIFFSLTPDGKNLIYTDSENILRIWNFHKGKEIICVPEIGHNALAIHPFCPIAVCANELGALNLVQIFGLEISPIILTAFEKVNDLYVKCPACQAELPIKRSQLGSELLCLTKKCDKTLSINFLFIKDSTSSLIEANPVITFSYKPRIKKDKQGFGTLIEIPAGPFLMGTDEKDIDDIINQFPGYRPTIFDKEIPQHIVELPTYWIGKNPISVKQFFAFLQESYYRWDEGKVKQKNKTHPIVHVNWFDITSFCTWLTLKWRSSRMINYNEIVRIPSEAEWEKAARGPLLEGQEESAKRMFPWGNELPTVDHCNFGKNVMTTSTKSRSFGDVIRSTTPIGEYSPKGDSPYGCVDMAGNVWEWTSSVWGKDTFKLEYKYPYNPKDGREEINPEKSLVIRGGAFHDDAIKTRVTYRDNCWLKNYDPYRSNRRWTSSLGFRIVVGREK